MTASPIMTLFREFEAKYEQAADLSVGEKIANDLLDECSSLEKRIVAIPCASMQDVAAKLIVTTRYGDFVLDDRGEGGLLDEALAILSVRQIAPQADPLLALIKEYREQLAINNATECGDLASEETVADATYRPSYNRLCTNPPAATSYEGALAAIRLVADEEETSGNQPDLTVKVLRAALAFLEGGQRNG